MGLWLEVCRGLQRAKRGLQGSFVMRCCLSVRPPCRLHYWQVLLSPGGPGKDSQPIPRADCIHVAFQAKAIKGWSGNKPCPVAQSPLGRHQTPACPAPSFVASLYLKWRINPSMSRDASRRARPGFPSSAGLSTRKAFLLHFLPCCRAMRKGFFLQKEFQHLFAGDLCDRSVKENTFSS